MAKQKQSQEQKHPPYHNLEIIIGNDSFITGSTRKEKLLMDIDFRKHPAWTKDNASFINESNKNIASFSKKFAGLSFGAKKKTAESN